LNWRLWTWKDIVGVAAVALVFGGIIYAVIFVPHSKVNSGFGPEWDCRPVGVVGVGTDSVCTKKPRSN
jgi:hypothetical protein